MTIHLLSGFLGSGKTTAVQHAATLLLKQNKKVGVITNDQGSHLVDGNLFKALGIPGRQVINGCFCCNYQELDNNIQSLFDTNNTDIIFAESVGSCTDIVATILKPLLQYRPGATVTISTFTDIRLLQMMLNKQHSFDPSIEYIYLKQLEEASIIIINKIDLANADTIKNVETELRKSYPGKTLIFQNSLDERSIMNWLKILENNSKSQLPPPSLDINYDIYAEGEARLAWLDESLEIFSSSNNAMANTQLLINNIYKKVTAANYNIGHLKFLVDEKHRINFTSAPNQNIEIPVSPKSTTTLLINIRVETSPSAINTLVAEAIKQTEKECGCKILVNSIDAFQPGYPIPQYRM